MYKTFRTPPLSFSVLTTLDFIQHNGVLLTSCLIYIGFFQRSFRGLAFILILLEKIQRAVRGSSQKVIAIDF